MLHAQVFVHSVLIKTSCVADTLTVLPLQAGALQHDAVLYSTADVRLTL